MLRIYKRIRQTLTHSLLAVAATSPMVLAQGLGNSPYSAQGVGEFYSPGNVTNMGMGDVGISNASSFYLNLQNPALLARRTRFTVFEVGLVGQSKTISQNISNSLKSQSNFAGNLGYLALSFPANSRWNMSVNLKPYTYVNYNIQQVTAVPGTPYYAEYNYTGKGGLNKATFANGVRITKNIYAGVEASFLFGNITNSSDARTIVSSSDIRVTHLNRANYSDIVWKLGAAWRPKINDTWTLNVGATYDPKLRINATQTDIYQKTSLAGQAIATPDTLRLNSHAQATLPEQMHFGISVERGNNLLVGVDVGIQKWSQYRTAENKAGNLVDGMTVAAGLEYTPKPTSNRYKDLITYRAGFQYNNLPYLATNGVQLTDINGSLGVSIPLGAYYVNHVTLSLVGGQRGVLSGTQIKEQYVRFGLGFSLNDWWFRKSVID